MVSISIPRKSVQQNLVTSTHPFVVDQKHFNSNACNDLLYIVLIYNLVGNKWNRYELIKMICDLWAKVKGTQVNFDIEWQFFVAICESKVILMAAIKIINMIVGCRRTSRKPIDWIGSLFYPLKRYKIWAKIANQKPHEIWFMLLLHQFVYLSN